MKIFLVGMPGSGKSTLGKLLAEKLRTPFFDLDEVIEQEEGAPVRQIFKGKGEAYFREKERDYLKSITNAHPAFVLATGGGAPCFFDNMQYMKEQGKVVFLNIPIEVLALRLQNEGLARRPLLKDFSSRKQLETYLGTTLEKRISFYGQAAVQTGNTASITAMVGDIVTQLS